MRDIPSSATSKNAPYHFPSKTSGSAHTFYAADPWPGLRFLFLVGLAVLATYLIKTI